MYLMNSIFFEELDVFVLSSSMISEYIQRLKRIM